MSDELDLSNCVGKRIEIPVHYDMWMRGARFGVISSSGRRVNGHSAYVFVKLDHPEVKRRLKLWRVDWEYAKLV